MDVITHLSSGIFASQFLSNKGKNRKYYSTGIIIASILPDIDAVLYFINRETYLFEHRGFTHSILGSFILAALLAWIFKLISKNKITFVKFFLLSLLGIDMHIFLDLITSFGTMILYPFSRYKFSLDLVFIVDLTLTLLFLIPVVLAKVLKKRSAKIYRAGIVLLIIYLMLCWTMQIISIKNFKNTLSVAFHIPNMDKYQYHSMPQPVCLFDWLVIAENKDKYLISRFNLFQKQLKIFKIDKITHGNGVGRDFKGHIFDQKKQKRIIDFYRFPYCIYSVKNDSLEKQFYDVRYVYTKYYKNLSFILDEVQNKISKN